MTSLLATPPAWLLGIILFVFSILSIWSLRQKRAAAKEELKAVIDVFKAQSLESLETEVQRLKFRVEDIEGILRRVELMTSANHNILSEMRDQSKKQ